MEGPAWHFLHVGAGPQGAWRQTKAAPGPGVKGPIAFMHEHTLCLRPQASEDRALAGKQEGLVLPSSVDQTDVGLFYQFWFGVELSPWDFPRIEGVQVIR